MADAVQRRLFAGDFAADVCQLMSPYYMSTVVPHFVLTNPAGDPFCCAMPIGTLFVSTWYRRLVYQLTLRKQSQLCLIDRVECDDNFSLKFYPVSFAQYQALVPADQRGRVFSPCFYSRLVPVTLQ